jgi:hypothetical protein
MRYALPLLLLAGCPNTGADADPLVPDGVVVRAFELFSVTATVVAEIGQAVAAPASGPGACPTVAADDQDVVIDFREGCVPSSGHTADELHGTAALTIAEGNGWFIGTLTELSVGAYALSGEVSGNTASAGQLLEVDADLDALPWVTEGGDGTIGGYLEIDADAAEVSLDWSGGELVSVSGEAYTLELEGAVIARGGLGGCAVPSAGTLRLTHGGGSATVTLSPDSAASGSVTIAFNERDSVTLSPCP